MWSGPTSILAGAICDLSLPDHRGGIFRFSEHLDRPLVVVFVRGHWCPYCRRYLSKLQSHLSAFAQRGAEVVAISPEPPATSAALARQLELTYPILSDSEGLAIDQFDVRNRFSSSAALLPHASVFVVAPGGGVFFRSIDRNYKKRTTMRAIVRALDDLQSGSIAAGGAVAGA